MKKVLALILASLMIVSLAACNNGGNNTSKAPETTENASKSEEATTKAPDTTVDDRQITITYWDENASDERTPYFMDLIDMFQKENPNIKIDYFGLVQAESLTKFLTAIETGTTPDTCGMKGDQQAVLVNSDQLVELDQYCENWDEFKDLTPAVMQVLRDRGQGKLYLLPRSANVSIFWYNKTRFDAAGLGDPYDWTWSDWFDALDAVNDANAHEYALAFRGGKGGADSLYNYIYDYMGTTKQLGDDGYSTINNQDAIDFVEKYCGLYGEYTAESDITQTYTDMTLEFDSGAANMMFHNLGSFPNHITTFPEMNMEFGAAPLPKSDITGKTVGWSGALASCMFKSCPEENREAAFKWIAFLASEEGNGYFNMKIGQLPTNTRCSNADWLNEQFHIKMALELTSSDRYIEEPSLSYMPGWAQSLTDMEAEIQDLAQSLNGNGTMTSKQLIEDWEASINAFVDDYNATNK